MRRRLHSPVPAKLVAAALLAAALLGCSSSNTGDDSRPSEPAEVAGDTQGSSQPAPTSAAPTTTPQPVLESATPPSNDQLARTLSEIEGAVADPAVSDEELGELGFEHQRAYRSFGKLSVDEQAAVLSLVDPNVRSIVEQMATAGGSLRSLTEGAPASNPTATTPPPSTLPAWNIVTPEPATTLRSYYDATEAATGAPWSVLASINFVETRFGRIVGPSSAGALGPMQFLPSTWDLYGEGGDIYDPRTAIGAAGRLLAATGAPSDISNAVYRYNPTNRYVTSVLTYANLLEANPRRLVLWHGWQVYVRGPQGTVQLPEGFTNIAG